MITMVADSMDNWPFMTIKGFIRVDLLLELLMLTAFGAYFAGRTIEKLKHEIFVADVFALVCHCSGRLGFYIHTGRCIRQ